jgi:hypothetical protein
MQSKTYLAILLSSLLTNTYAAPGDAVPNTFSPDTVASSSAVNNNFTEVVNQIGTVNTSVTANTNNIASNTTAINTNSTNISNNTTAINANASNIAALPGATSYDYNDFTHTLTQKVFTVVTSNDSFDLEVQNFNRPNATTVIMERIRSYLGTTNQNKRLHYDTSSDRVLTRWDNYNNAGSTLNSYYTFTPGVPLGSTNMLANVPRASGVVANHFDGVGTPAGSSAVITESYVMGLEDITVPAGSYTGCLKSYVYRTSVTMGHSVRQVNWHCPGVGLAKRIHTQHNSSALDMHTRVMELSSVTP